MPVHTAEQPPCSPVDACTKGHKTGSATGVGVAGPGDQLRVTVRTPSKKPAAAYMAVEQGAFKAEGCVLPLTRLIFLRSMQAH